MCTWEEQHVKVSDHMLVLDNWNPKTTKKGVPQIFDKGLVTFIADVFVFNV